MSDEALLERATALNRVFVTLDADLLQIAGDWVNSGREFTGIAYARQLSVTVGQMVGDLEIMNGVLNAFEMRNVVEFLPL